MKMVAVFCRRVHRLASTAEEDVLNTAKHQLIGHVCKISNEMLLQEFVATLVDRGSMYRLLSGNR